MQEVQNIFNKLPQEDKRKFLITNILKDFMFAGYFNDIKNDFMQYIYSKEKCEKIIKERTEKRFMECCYAAFREYEDAVKKCVANGCKNKQDIYNILKAQNLIETYAECQIINCKDRFGDCFADLIVNLYNNTNPIVVKHLNDKDVSLKSALIALFENPFLLKKTRDKYNKYEIEANKLTFEDANLDSDTDTDEENYNSAQRRFIYGSEYSSSDSDDSGSEMQIDSDDDEYKPKPRPIMTEEELFERLQTPIALLNTLNVKKQQPKKTSTKETKLESITEVKPEVKQTMTKKPSAKETKKPSAKETKKETTAEVKPEAKQTTAKKTPAKKVK
jgi:hypothetical protein